MSDESIINLSDSAKTTMRNYAMVAGFMTLFIYAVVRILYYLSDDPSSVFVGNNNMIFKTVIAFSLLLFGSVLAFLHKRDLVAITFLIIGLYNSCATMEPVFGTATLGGACPHLIVAIIMGIAMLFTRNEQKYVCALMLIPGNILRLASYGMGLPASVTCAGLAIIALVSLYAVLCIGLENPRFPGYRFLTADEEYEICDGSPVHFKTSGSILGYSMMMIPMVASILYIMGIVEITYVDFQLINTNCGLMMILMGFLMLTAGRMKFTPFMFMMVGIVMVVQPVIGTTWIISIFLLIIAALCLFRSDRRILVGVTILIYAITAGLIGVLPSGIVLALILIQAIILAYVCFALCSDNRLKLI